ncbi:hypothetical protein Glove_262g47 [Diversispora epigaea]|uniref:Uncharacterized protein n=1 Tax=Diversispora epigaea TaxID=1348612 RepID=A0A397I873_9GLOM|nr:hypothetical protein Glove_262g47 [Diversispora epigaea]
MPKIAKQKESPENPKASSVISFLFPCRKSPSKKKASRIPSSSIIGNWSSLSMPKIAKQKESLENPPSRSIIAFSLHAENRQAKRKPRESHPATSSVIGLLSPCRKSPSKKKAPRIPKHHR